MMTQQNDVYKNQVSHGHPNGGTNTGNATHEGSINAKDFLIGSLIGGIVGAATALFLAPKSGKELRDDLNTHAGTLKEKAASGEKQLWNEAMNLLPQLRKNIRDHKVCDGAVH